MFGLSEKGFKRKRYDDLLASMSQRAQDLFGKQVNLSERSPLGLFFRVVAWFIAQLWSLAEKVYSSGYVDSAEGIQLDKLARHIGITRRSSLKARGWLTITGDPETILPAGFTIATQDGIEFITILDVQLNDQGMVLAEVEAKEAGKIGNVPARTITEIVTPYAGIEGVINEEAIGAGRDEETDAELRERYILSVSKIGASTADSIRASILDLQGVRSCIVEFNDTMYPVKDLPPKSVAPIVYGGEEQEIVKAIAETKAAGIQSYGDIIVEQQDIGGNVHQIGFRRPVEKNIYMQIKLQTDNRFPPNGKQLVKTEIIKYIGGIDQDSEYYYGLGLGESVIFTRIISVVHRIPGIIDIPVLHMGVEADDLQSMHNIPIGVLEVAKTDWEKVVIE